MRPLLQTKLHIPPHRPRLVSRPRLVDLLNAGLPPSGAQPEARDLPSRTHHAFPRALTLLSAPAGFGKTTLLTDWVHYLRLDAAQAGHAGYEIAWLSLDDGDNDPALFLAYVIAALQTVNADLGKGAQSAVLSPQPPPAEAVLIELINDVVPLPKRIVLILDDYHLIDGHAIHDALGFLVEHLPPQMHLVISTREDPLLPLARLRARNLLTELRATDLRFTPSEAAEFLNQVMGLGLSVEDIASLEARTEGWIAGLHLAALALQGLAPHGSLSTQAQKDATSFIRSFAGSHRYVLDYLVEEVLEQQPKSIQAFLLRTSIVDRLCGSLSDALLLDPSISGKETLEHLEHANLFVVPLDEERRWYRYHQLFSELLRQRLHQTEPDLVQGLHVRASEWYELNTFFDGAIGHALSAGDLNRAARLLEEHADAMWARGGHAKLQRWLASLPGEVILRRPLLSLFHAWFLYAKGPRQEAEQYLQAAEEARDCNPGLRGRAAVIRAFMASYRGDVPGLMEQARRALEYLPKQDLIWRSIVAIALGDAQGFRGDMQAAYEARLEAAEASAAAGSTVFSTLAYLKVAITLREQGQLQQTAEMCRDQIQVVRNSGLSGGSVMGCLQAILAEVLAEQGDLEGALPRGRQGVELAERGGDWSLFGWSCLCLIRILVSAGDMTDAQGLVHKVNGIARKSVLPPWIISQVAAWQAKLWLAEGQVDAAAHWAESRGLPLIVAADALSPMDYFELIDYILLARILIVQGQLDRAAGLLRALLQAAEAGDRRARAVEILSLQALAFQAAGDSSQAMAAIERALTLAEPMGFFRVFVDEGPAMARLLYEAAAQGIAPQYTRRLLAAFPATLPEQNDASPAPASESGLLEPLSDREREVLELVAEGLTNGEIASRLFLSLNTVKGHTRSIYGKLGVHSRTQAAARARALGVLPFT